MEKSSEIHSVSLLSLICESSLFLKHAGINLLLIVMSTHWVVTLAKNDKLNFEGFEDIVEINKGVPYFKILVGGEWVMGETFAEVKSPLTLKTIAMVSRADLELANRVLEVASASKEKIKSVPGAKRIDIMEDAAKVLESKRETIVRALVGNVGKPKMEAEGEVRATIDRLLSARYDAHRIKGDLIPGDWANQNKGKIAVVERDPVGVVLAISPFNYPLFISYTKVIPGLIAGNSVILKPPSAVPIPALMMAHILDRAGIPKGTFSCIVAPGDIASYLATSDEINMITFTGSTEVGLTLTNISGIKKIHLELGGKASAIVTKNVRNFQTVAKSIVDGSFKFSGQRCDAISRVLAESSITQQLLESIVIEAKKFRLNSHEESPQPIGPLIDQPSAERVKGLIDDAVFRGAKILFGGNINRNYVEPTVLSDVPLSARIMWEETFGPVIPVHSYFTEEEAIGISNKSEYGLDSAVFTDDITEALRIARKIEAGEVTINAFPAHGIGFFPFGGVKQSGFGREGIGFSIDEFTNMKTIVISTSD